MSQVRAIVLAGNGINCEMETAHACKMAGADEVHIVYLWDLAAGDASLDGYQLLCFPGGFLDGDDLGSARASAIRLRHTSINGESLLDQLRRYVERGGLALGICNGFQLMIKLGLLPGAGGTQRLPRAIGLQRALNMIVSGETVPAAQLSGTALLDAVTDGDVVDAAVALAEKVVAEAQPCKRLRDLQVRDPQAEAFLQFARNTVAAGAGPYPAPPRCVFAGPGGPR